MHNPYLCRQFQIYRQMESIALMKRIIVSIATAVVFCGVLVTTSCTNAISEWPRKYATTVVRGHVTNMPEDMEHVLSFRNNWNITQEFFPHVDIDSAGIFCYSYDMCWPIYLETHLCGIWSPLLLCPGDTIDIEMDYAKAVKLGDDRARLFSEALLIRGGHWQLSPEFRAHVDRLQLYASILDYEYLQAHPKTGIAEYCDLQWKRHLNLLNDIDTLDIDNSEKMHLRLKIEERYVSKVRSFAKERNIKPVDIHADSLLFPENMAAACYFDTSYSDYLKVNGLYDKPMGRYLRERKQAEDLVARIKVMQEVSPEEIDKLPAEFRQAAIELKAKMDEKATASKSWEPSGDPATWLEKIVGRHHGKVVYIDFWATWCGACLMGINEMAPVKEDYEKRGVDFVYITDHTSSLDGYDDMKEKHPGDHFIFTKNDINAMNIPEYSGAIPHYLIYDRDGKLIKAIIGWSGLEDMTQELDKALALQ